MITFINDTIVFNIKTNYKPLTKTKNIEADKTNDLLCMVVIMNKNNN